MIGGSGWFRTTCARVKRPLHLQSGLTLRIHRARWLRRRAAPVSGLDRHRPRSGRHRGSDAPTGASSSRARGRPRSARKQMLASSFSLLVLQSGIEPASTAYRADALPLCYKSVIASRCRRTRILSAPWSRRRKRRRPRPAGRSRPPHGDPKTGARSPAGRRS